MSKRICWKKGMRLTDEVLRASSDAELELIGKSLALGSAGRFGLLPSLQPFSISLNIGKENIEIESLNCLAITKERRLIDVNYNAQFDKTFETKVTLPNHLNASELYLTIDLVGEEWRELSNGYEEPVYQFSLITPNNPIAGNSFPIAHLVNSEYGGWHVDDLDFVPPCLYLSSHPKYLELFSRFQSVLSNMNEKTRSLIDSKAKSAMRMFLPLLRQIMIETDKNRELLTPMMLLGLIQRYICAFTTSFELDEIIGLSDADTFYNYAFSPYSLQNAYQKAKEGLELCLTIQEKMDKIQTKAPEPKPQAGIPFISENQLYQNCRTRSLTITVTRPSGNTTVLYSIDGSEPTHKLAGNSQIVLENGFQKQKTPEPDKTIVIKLKGIANGVSSETVSYTITMHKDYRVWDGYEI